MRGWLGRVRGGCCESFGRGSMRSLRSFRGAGRGAYGHDFWAGRRSREDRLALDKGCGLIRNRSFVAKFGAVVAASFGARISVISVGRSIAPLFPARIALWPARFWPRVGRAPPRKRLAWEGCATVPAGCNGIEIGGGRGRERSGGRGSLAAGR